MRLCCSQLSPPLPLDSPSASRCNSEDDCSSKATVTLEIPRMEGLLLLRTFTRRVTHFGHLKLIIVKTMVCGLHTLQEAAQGHTTQGDAPPEGPSLRGHRPDIVKESGDVGTNPGSPVVVNPCFHHRGHGFDPCSGN